MPTVIHQLADAFLERKRELAEKRKAKSVLPQSDYFMPKSSKEDMETQQRLLEEQGLPGVIKEGAKKMYENPVVNTAIGLVPGPSDIQAAGEFGRSLYEGRPWYETAGWAISAVPGIPTVGGILAGKGAKTADLAKLAMAEDMAKAGASRDEIWNATGWFQGPDKQWKFEIPDYQANFKGNVANELRKKAGVEQGRIFEHPALYEAYPEAAKIWTSKQAKEGTAAYAPGVMGESDMIGLGMPSRGIPNLEELKGSNLHELQHSIQGKEGFAQGGMPEDMYSFLVKERQNKLADEHDALLARFMELKTKYQNVPLNEIPENVSKEVSELKPKISALQNSFHQFGRRAEIGGADFSEDELYNAYRRLAGEEEARLVQRRMEMTPEELRKTPPWKMYEAPEEQQFVKIK